MCYLTNTHTHILVLGSVEGGDRFLHEVVESIDVMTTTVKALVRFQVGENMKAIPFYLTRNASEILQSASEMRGRAMFCMMEWRGCFNTLVPLVVLDVEMTLYNILRKESEAVLEGNDTVPQQEEFGPHQPTLADLRVTKI